MIATMPIDDAALLNGCLGPRDMQTLVDAAARYLFDAPLSGVGIELGAGLGVLSATIARLSDVDGVFALEICPNFVELVIPAVASVVLGERARTVVPTFGSFETIELEDASMDFAVEIDSLHHAEDLDAALDECARVLKPGGRLVCFDRAQPDDLPDWLRDRMLDHEYSTEWIEQNGYPPGIRMTRRENGEHEIRIGEWLAAFARSGMTTTRVVHFVPTVTTKLAAKAALSYLPRSVRARVITMPVPREYFRAWIPTRLAGREAVGSGVIAPKLVTGMLVTR
jgi:ubiquinone/menaquinone biosynthesis C-methylase UbiE